METRLTDKYLIDRCSTDHRIEPFKFLSVDGRFEVEIQEVEFVRTAWHRVRTVYCTVLRCSYLAEGNWISVTKPIEESIPKRCPRCGTNDSLKASLTMESE